MDERFLLSRRALLGGVGALGLASLLPRSRALAAAPPTRLIVVHVPEGMWSGAKRPSAGATTLGPIFGAMDQYMSSINVLNNLAMKSRDHGPGGDGHHRGVVHMFTGTEMKDENSAGGPSIDQKIAAAIGGSTPLQSLQLAVRIVYQDTNSKPIWSGPGRVVPALQDPWQAYKRVFTDAVVKPVATTPTAPAAPAFDLRKSALDHALADIGSLRTRLSTSDRERLDSYQESLRDIERRLATVGNSVNEAEASSCTPPTLGTSINVAAEANYPKIAQLQMDIAVAALQCNVTRVISLQFGNSNDQCAYSWLGVNSLGHDLSHNNNNCDPTGSKKQTVYDWYSKQFAYLMGKLQGVTEGGVPMLNNTLVLWASEFGESNGHNGSNLLWFLMGNAGGYFKTGQVLNCGGRSVNDLHVSLQNAMGIPDTTFGNPAYCQGPLPGLRA